MPTYEFRCQKCDKSFELNYSISEFERARKAGIPVKALGSYSKFLSSRSKPLRRAKARLNPRASSFPQWTSYFRLVVVRRERIGW